MTQQNIPQPLAVIDVELALGQLTDDVKTFLGHWSFTYAPITHSLATLLAVSLEAGVKFSPAELEVELEKLAALRLITIDVVAEGTNYKLNPELAELMRGMERLINPASSEA